MLKSVKNQNGFSMVEILMGAALAGVLAITMITMFQNQNKALRGITGKNEAQMMRNIIYEIMRNPDNCAASVRASHPAVPNFNNEISLGKIVTTRRLPNGTYQFSDFYHVGKTYAGLVKIESIKIRPHIPQDETPGHKFIVHFEITGDISGPKHVTKKMEFTFDSNPTAAIPSYPLSCVTGIIGSSVPRCRVCVQISDSGCTSEIGPVQCGPWVTQPNTQAWSNWASDTNKYDPDCTRVALECQ